MSDQFWDHFLFALGMEKRKLEAEVRLRAAREALAQVTPTELHAQCPVCCGRGVLSVLFGAKDDEDRR